jgi:hypothetical protein
VQSRLQPSPSGTRDAVRLSVLQPVQSSTPVQQALAQTVQAPVFRQDSISALLTSLAGLGGKLTELPKPVAQAGRELLNARLDLSAKPLSGDSLTQAFVHSDVLFESKLVRSPGQTRQQGDVKSVLLRLAGSLRQWRGEGAQPKHSPDQRLLPPTGSPTPRSDRPVSIPVAPDLPGKEVGARLLGQAKAAPARSLNADFVYAGTLGTRTPARVRVASGPVYRVANAAGELGIGRFHILRDGSRGRWRPESAVLD